MSKRKPSSLKDLPEPSERERNAIEAATKRQRTIPPRVSVSAEHSQQNKLDVRTPHSDQDGWGLRLQDAFGTSSIDFASVELNRLLSTIQPDGGRISEADVNAALAMVDGVKPRNEAEAMLALQMAATHVLAMECLQRTRHAQTVPQFESSGTLATKFLRTFMMQSETLAKLRRGGEQTVRVEHVHVHSGGQAIVGNINHGGKRGGGGKTDSDEQAHTSGSPAPALAHALEPAMWSPNALGEPMPVASGERKEALPDAWWGQGKRRAEG